MLILAQIFCISFSLLVAIINYRWLKPYNLKIFVPFLAITLITELAGIYTKYVVNVPNGILYNAYVFLQVVFCAAFLRNCGLQPVFRRIVSFGIALYVLTTVIIYLFFTKIGAFNITLFLFGGFLVVMAAIFFLFSYFMTDDRSAGLKLEPVIWIAAGLIAYFAVLSITVALLDYILYYNLEVSGIKLHNFMPRLMSIIMYLCFAYAFYRCRALKLE